MAASEKALEVYELIKKHLDDQDFHYTPHDEDLAITLTVQGDDLPQPTVIRVHDQQSVLRVYSPIPSSIPEDKRVDAAVAVAMLNSHLLLGSFDLDMTDGKVVYGMSQSFEGIDLTEEFIRTIFGAVFVITDKYNDKFFAFGKGMISLEDLIS